MDASKKYPHIAMYGNIGIERRYCVDCKRFAFVIDRKIQCCDALVESVPTKTCKRMSVTPPGRNIPKVKERERILKEQNNSCFWCDRRFGCTVWRHNKRIVLRIEGDHYVPYVYSQDNRPSNFVAACQVCNKIKSCLMLPSAEEFRVHIQSKRTEKGYSDVRPMWGELSPETPIAKVL